ncbi:MAG: phosphoadenylyl-sulfate reductase [Hyphomicrobiaceae bacterium]|nr:phosphoadenylyl-sulfate reductase [Hyphomicrobiaceae bacterium]
MLRPSQEAGDNHEQVAADLDRRLGRLPTLEARLHVVAQLAPGPIAFSTSLGLEDQAILHAIAAEGAKVDVFTLDTGRHFPETIDTLARTEQRYGLRIRVVTPEAADVESLVARDGIMGFRLSIEARKACCEVRKVRPLRRALAGAGSWITGLRRDQSAGRSHIRFAAVDCEHRVVKISPLADWSLNRLEAFIAANEVPINPLYAQGFPSIGCQPCTRATSPGEDVRAGRWWWETQDGKECGLHANPRRPVRGTAA